MQIQCDHFDDKPLNPTKQFIFIHLFYKMETLVKLNTQTAGRDKLARLLQYLSRFLWHRLQLNQKDGVYGLKNLEFQLSTFRKILRFGRCIDSLYATLPLFRHPDSTIRYTVILSKICNALFLLADHILWLGRGDLCKVNTDKWSQISNKYWLYSITMNLVRDFYEIVKIIKLENIKKDPNNWVSFTNSCAAGSALICGKYNRAVLLDSLKNTCDFFIPLNALGYTKLSPGAIGLLGVVSSIAGLVALIDPKSKLSPA